MRKYFAATLKEDRYFFEGWHSKFVIEHKFEFDSESLRDEWLNDETQNHDKIAISGKIYRKKLDKYRHYRATWISYTDWFSSLLGFAGGWNYRAL